MINITENVHDFYFLFKLQPPTFFTVISLIEQEVQQTPGKAINKATSLENELAKHSVHV